MKDLNINRDTNQPSDEALLKHQNFDEVLKKANVDIGSNTSNLAPKKWWFIGGSSLVVLAIVVLTINSITKSTNENKKSYYSDNQGLSVIEKYEFENISILNNISEVENHIDLDNPKPVNIAIRPDTTSNKPIEYYYPKEVSTLTFKLEESFGLKEQYQQFEEFSIYDNLSFQPIGDYQSGWLKASWTKVELVEKSGNYFLMLTKNGTAFPCQVVPVFESEDYVKALEDYSNAIND